MAYIIYSVSLFTIILGMLLYVTRGQWSPRVREAAARIPIPGRNSNTINLNSNSDSRSRRSWSWNWSLYGYARLPTTFAGDAEAGLSSSTFDLSGNMEGGDARAGLDDAAKAEVLRIMKKRRLRFDDARRVYLEQRFQANGIAADGRPKDPKFVSFS